LLAELAQESQATLVLATHDARVSAALPDALSWRLEGAAA
jgi:ABC-type lipoprotein export system ATPase subunit